MRRPTKILWALMIAGSVAARGSDVESRAAAEGTPVTNEAPAGAGHVLPAAIEAGQTAPDPDEAARQLELKRAMAEAAESPREEPAPVAGLEAFRIIFDRNIFNPNRSARRLASGRSESPRPVRRERFTLVGTMSYEKGHFAFFDGSSAEFRKVAQPDETIAGYRIVEIAANSVTLASTNGPPVQLVVGMQMQREDDAEWQLSARQERLENATGTAPASATATLATRPPDLEDNVADDDDEVLKRLLQKREEEFNNEK